MRVNIVSGFLGSGKTTLLRHILSGQLPNERVAVLVNEVGKIGFDGALLAREGFDMIEMTGGCICCVLRTNLVEAVGNIARSVRPDRLVIETTGVAHPADVVVALRHPAVGGLIEIEPLITVVDCEFFPMREVFAEFYEAQIRAADTVVLNKTDLVDAAALTRIRADLHQINPYASVLPTTHGAIDAEYFYSRSLARAFETEVDDHHHDSGGHFPAEAAFVDFTFESEAALDESRFRAFLGKLPDRLWRAKGYARLPQGSAFLNYAIGRYSLEPWGTDQPTRLVFIGSDVSPDEVLRPLRACVLG
jgi:G3E family GTPase